MGRLIPLAGALLVVATAAATWSLRAQDGEGGDAIDAAIDWRTDLAAATAEAAKSGRPMLVVFR